MKILSLNASYIPIRLSSVYSTISRFYCGAVEAIYIKGDNWSLKTWDEWWELSRKDVWPEGTQFINSTTQRVAIPKVVKCTKYDKIPKVSFRLSRKAIYERDKFICYICGKKFSEGKLSIDHVIPLSKKGKNDWTNMATCCKECNSMKGDKLLSELGIKAKYLPVKPTMSNIQKLKSQITQYDKDWKLFGI
jgi:5-methylcytosine-specific restriction endonuclease McrA